MGRTTIGAVFGLLLGCGSDFKSMDIDGDGYTPVAGDCWDATYGRPEGSGLGGVDIHPGATETWYDGVDQDCAGDNDYDQDGDGYESADYGGDDCNDADADTYPGAEEVCEDPHDYNCDGSVGYADADTDGYAACEDCDDGDPTINPGATEVWYDGVDQDCAGDNDYDQDGDGYESADYGGDDCNDADADTYPGAEEVCDGVDNDCDGDVDNHCVNF